MKTNLSTYITLKDGRSLGYAEYGFSNGFPILFFHGLPGSRFEAEKLHAAALKLQVRLIGLDRPGMGLSSHQKNRTILDWPNDISEFTTSLNLKKFSIVGHSGGAPYVLKTPQKIKKHSICHQRYTYPPWFSGTLSLPQGYDQFGAYSRFVVFPQKYNAWIQRLSHHLFSQAR
jgi:pimeloyl-ACP methyl ester carboxylesterase